MAASITPQSSPLGTKVVQDTDAAATLVANVTGAAGSVYLVEVDNAANATSVFVKLFDAAAPTLGTTAPDYVFRFLSGQRRAIAVPAGLVFSTAISYAVTTGAATSDVTPPASDVILRLVTS